MVSARLTARLEKSKAIQKRSPISVTMQRDTAILRGRVATEHDRDLAAAMLMLEPGVGQVQNELVVESPPPAAQGVSTR
jgi:osmotically-inducible protein OsmY